MVAVCQLKLLKQSDWKQPSNLGSCAGYKMVSTMTQMKAHYSWSHAPEFHFPKSIHWEGDRKVQTWANTHIYKVYDTHPRTHVRQTDRDTFPGSCSQTRSTLNFICPVKLPKLPFLILPFNSKARRVIHNLGIFFLSLPPNANPCSTHSLLNDSRNKPFLLIEFPAEIRMSSAFSLTGDSDSERKHF